VPEKQDGIGFKIIALAVYAFMAAPIVIVVLASFSPTSFLAFPPKGLSLKWYYNIFDDNGFVSGFFNSMFLASVATAIDVMIAIPAAIAVTKYHFPGKTALTNFFTSPMFLPTVTFGFVLLQAFSAVRGVPTFYRLLAGHLIIILPYIFRNVVSVMIGFNWTLEEAAQSLGARPLQTFRRVTLPLIKPGIMAGGLLAFLYSLDDATVSAFISDHRFVTLPIRMMTYMEFSFDPTLAAISTVLIALSLGAIVLMERFVGLNIFLK